jgi:hypothetical protein
LATSKPAAATSSSALRLGRMQQPNQRERGRERVALLLRTRRTGLLDDSFWLGVGVGVTTMASAETPISG